MSAEDVAAASLAALEKGEMVCIPALADAAVFDTLMEMQGKAFRTAVSQTTLAPRYRT
jgi:hypothetical protein